MSRVWQLQNAKARFAEVVRRASAEGPQIVTYRGIEKAVVISIEEFRRLESNRPSFVQHLLSAPKLDEETVELVNGRAQDAARDLGL